MDDDVMGEHRWDICVGPQVPRYWALFLDIDGTLLHIHETPQGVWVDPDLLELMQQLYAASHGALALISGRTLAEIDRLFSPMRFPAAGQHGVERRDATGRLHRHPQPQGGLDRLRAQLALLKTRCPSVLVEDKGQTLAIHFRQEPQCADEVEQLLTDALKYLGDGWNIQPGKMVFEIKPTGKDKGTTIAEFMAEYPFLGRTPIFIGDDATDEYGFAAVNELGGISIKVGSGATVAQWRIDSVEAVRSWLDRCLMNHQLQTNATENPNDKP